MIFVFLNRHKQTILYGFSLAVLLFLLKWMEMRLLVFHYSFEIYVGFIAVFFMVLGIWVASQLFKPKTETIVVEKEIYLAGSSTFITDEKELAKSGISKRELEVLQLMSEGLSNKEIADRLFVSENTIKTHSSKLFEKLEVSRRTQAVDKGKKIKIIA